MDSADSEVDLIKMLKGFYLIEHLDPDQISEINMVKMNVESFWSQAETDFNTTLDSAISFCNSDGCSSMKNDLHA